MPKTPSSKVKRIQPDSKTLRELFLKSGNLCAFPKCARLMMNSDGVFVGQICHIEAALPEGERFNPSMTERERADKNNLLLLCYEHHRVTNDVNKFTVEVMRQMKADHEKKFASPERSMTIKFVDSTTLAIPKEPENLNRLQKMWNEEFSKDELEKRLDDLSRFVDVIKKAPIELRKFIGAAAMRLTLLEKTSILVDDMESALNVSRTKMKRLVDLAGEYNLAYVDDDRPGRYIFSLGTTGDWPILLDLAQFCKVNTINIDSFLIDLKFDQLDE